MVAVRAARSREGHKGTAVLALKAALAVRIVSGPVQIVVQRRGAPRLGDLPTPLLHGASAELLADLVGAGVVAVTGMCVVLQVSGCSF